MKLKRLGAGQYATEDGRYRVERQEGDTECSHPQCDVLHVKWLTDTRDGRGLVHWVTYVEWTVWDTQTNDYAGGQHPFDTKAEAVEWLERFVREAKV